jgi:DNA-binding phage protein
MVVIMKTLFAETEVPTWAALKADIRALPRGGRSEIARHLGVTPQAVYNLIHRGGTPSIDRFFKILSAFNAVNENIKRK